MSLAHATSQMSVQFVRRAELHHEADGPRRGDAHAAFISADAAGHLSFEPLVMCARGTMMPGEGFDMHPHAGVDNVLLILSGRVHHRGSDGSDWILEPGDVFVMSAGTGGEHAESVYGEQPVQAVVIHLRTAGSDAPCHFARAHATRSRSNAWEVRAGQNPSSKSGLALRCNAAVSTASLWAGAELSHEIVPGRRAYLVTLEGEAEVAGDTLREGDRLLAHTPGVLAIRTARAAQVLLIDLAQPDTVDPSAAI
jgi:quercetin 2,3-dioxygenase